MGFLNWTHAADGRPSGSSLQAVEQVDGMNPPKTTANQLDESKTMANQLDESTK
jgi:hypothetical protein